MKHNLTISILWEHIADHMVKMCINALWWVLVEVCIILALWMNFVICNLFVYEIV